MLVRPELPAGAPKGEEGIRRRFEATLRRVFSCIPVEPRMGLGGARGANGCRLGPSASLMRRVSRPIETPTVRARLHQHQVAARIWRPVGHAVQVGVEIHARAQLRGESFLSGPLDDLGDRKVRPLRLLPMKKGGRQPDLVSYLQLVPDFAHYSSI